MKMAGNPNWWAFFNNGISSINSNSSTMLQHSLSHQSSTYSETSTVSVPAQHFLPHHSSQLLDFPAHTRSCSQLLLGGLSEEKKVNQENWGEQVLNLEGTDEGSVIRVSDDDDVKLQGLLAAHQLTNSQNSNYNDHWNDNISSSSPNSCATTALRNSSSRLCFSGGRKPAAAEPGKRNQHSQEQSSEYSTSSGGVQPKKPRVQQSSAQPALKVRKEKLGDRITALHQLVSPFGKTDTASVLSEAIGYIRFLQGQIEVLNEHIGMDGRGVPNPNQEELGKDLRSRGLCLVPTSCTLHLANDGGADFWAPAPFGGGGAGGF